MVRIWEVRRCEQKVAVMALSAFFRRRSITHRAVRCLAPVALSTLVGALAVGVQFSAASAGSTTTTSTEAEVADALASVNYYRAMAGLAPVTINDSLAPGARNHSCYMLLNGMSHDESSAAPGYTVDGQYAGKHANIAVTSDATKSADGFVQLWMGAPFHAVGVLRPNLTSVSYGSCTDPAAPLAWRKGATLDVLSGLGPKKPIAAPILWPGNGATTKLDKFIVETPDPLAMCGWSSGGGLPVIAMMPEPATNVSATISGPTGALQVCALSSQNVSDPSAKSILAGNNAITVLPRNPLVPGVYTVTVTTDARVVSWSFTVDPQAVRPATPAPATNPPVATPPATTPPAVTQPVADTSVIGSAGGFNPTVPFRLADTRIGIGATRLAGGAVTRLQVAGQGTVPADARAVSANFTVIGAGREGYLTAFACTAAVPTASTVNFPPGAVTANSALIPLDATGGLCVFANVDTDLVVDINGFVSQTTTGRFVPAAAGRILDTRSAFRSPGRLAAGQTLEVQVTGSDTGVPADASAVSINVTAINAANNSYVTVYPCSAARPLASTLNPTAGGISSNSVIVGVSTTGTVCFYSPTDVDLVADLFGFVSSAAGARFTPLTAMRAMDTRDSQAVLNLGSGGAPLAAGSTHEISLAGIRGIPAGAQAMSLNITATDSADAGYVTIWPCTASRPTVSALNAAAGVTVANGIQAQLSSRGSLCIYTQNATHLIIDVNGFWGS